MHALSASCNCTIGTRLVLLEFLPVSVSMPEAPMRSSESAGFMHKRPYSLDDAHEQVELAVRGGRAPFFKEEELDLPEARAADPESERLGRLLAFS